MRYMVNKKAPAKLSFFAISFLVSQSAPHIYIPLFVFIKSNVELNFRCNVCFDRPNIFLG